MREKKAKYYLRDSWNAKGWFAICQVANNVVVCDCSDENIAKLILEYLNALPGSVTRHVKVEGSYPK